MQGLAKQYSLAFTGIQIDAIYHTSLVFHNIEYFFGQGIHRKIPGSTHHGRPMEIVQMGRTDLPMDVIEDYIDSLAQIYTPESYDLFLHNCNNFTQDLAMFLLGMDIPQHISSLPQRFLETPVGQMLRGQIDRSMRQMTQAPDALSGRSVHKAASQTNGSMARGRHHGDSPYMKPPPTERQMPQTGVVHNVTRLQQVDALLGSAKNSCAVIFFTSATCPPCKLVYPVFDDLAAEAGHKAVLIKVDLAQAYEVGSRYNVRVTPSFTTFLKGKMENEWSGANEAQLKTNVRLLLQMAAPNHPHTRLRLPSLQRKIFEPVTYKKTPPLDKLVAKIGHIAEDPSFANVVAYVKVRERDGKAEAALPNLRVFSERIVSSFDSIPAEVHFAVIDLVRISAADPRVSGFLATEEGHRTILTLLPPKMDYSTAGYNMQVVSLQLACNLFTSSIFHEQLINKTSVNMLRAAIENLASNCLLAAHSNARFLASALVYNLAMYDHNRRMDDQSDEMHISSMGDLEAALVESVINENESQETLHGLLLALGLVLYGASSDDSTWQLCTAMDVRAVLQEKAKKKMFAHEPLLKEVGDELLGNGNMR